MDNIHLNTNNKYIYKNLINFNCFIFMLYKLVSINILNIGMMKCRRFFLNCEELGWLLCKCCINVYFNFYQLFASTKENKTF